MRGNANRRSGSPAIRGLVAWSTTAVVLAILITALGATSAGAAGPHRVRANLADIEQEVMCPTCGTPLMVAQSPLADRERAFIRTRIARGETKEQIKREMVAEFGPGILATPPARGFDLSAYLVPAGAVLAALLAAAFGLLRWRRRGDAEQPEPPEALPAALSRRLDEELARYDM